MLLCASRKKKDIVSGSVKAISNLFNTIENRNIGRNRDNIIIVCKSLDWKYIPLNIATLVIRKEPNNSVVLYYKYKTMLNILTFSIHKIPLGILNGMNGAKRDAIPEMLKNLDEFEKLSNIIWGNDKAYINLCRRLYLAWDKYIDDINQYSGFEDYLKKHKVPYDK